MTLIIYILSILGWCASTIVAISGGFYTARILDRRKVIIRVRGVIFKIKDIAPQDSLGRFDIVAIDELRECFFDAVAHLSEEHQKEAIVLWQALKQIPASLPDENPESFMARFKKFSGDYHGTRIEAFIQTLDRLDKLFRKRLHSYIP